MGADETLATDRNDEVNRPFTRKAPRATLKPIPLPPLRDRPLVSVLIPSHNYASLVEGCLRSVLEQTYTRLEAVVCDDGSTDGSADIVARMATSDPRIKLIRKENGGQASALNRAFEASSGEVICFLDADDRFHPSKVERVVGRLLRSGGGAVVHRLLVIGEDGNELQVLPFGYRPESGWLTERLVRRGGRWGVAGGGAVTVRREVAEAIFPMPEERFRTADADAFVFTLVPFLAEIETIEEPLYLYLVHGLNTGLARALDLDVVARRISFIETTAAAVNERLEQLGIDFRIDSERNLALEEQLFLRDLFAPEGSLRRAARHYVSLVPRLLRDDLYTRRRKLGAAFAYGMALVLPRHLKSRFLSNVRAASQRQSARPVRSGR